MGEPTGPSWETVSEVDRQHLGIIREVVLPSYNLLEGLQDA